MMNEGKLICAAETKNPVHTPNNKLGRLQTRGS